MIEYIALLTDHDNLSDESDNVAMPYDTGTANN